MIFDVLIRASCHTINFQLFLVSNFAQINQNLSDYYLFTNFEQFWTDASDNYHA